MIAGLAAGVLFTAERIPQPNAVTTHEWGTFTSIADMKGDPMPWLAYGGPAALPCFVHRQPACIKCTMVTTVRMETPVIYFYTARKTALSVGVGFSQGLFTEWYPQGTFGGSRLEWKVEALPGETVSFPRGEQANHYYDARATDSAPLRAGNENEKLLFYRGVGDVPVPVRPKYTDAGRIVVTKTGANPVPAVIVFENHGGRIGFRTAGELRDSIELDAPELTGDLAALRPEFERTLTSAGLYPKEAAAMLATWRDSWCEEGTRVFYIVPRPVVDAALPLRIAPSPAAMERVFVGRIEVLSPTTRKEIVSAGEDHDRARLAKYGRFLEAFWQEMQRNHIVNTMAAAPKPESSSSPCAK